VLEGRHAASRGRKRGSGPSWQMPADSEFERWCRFTPRLEAPRHPSPVLQPRCTYTTATQIISISSPLARPFASSCLLYHPSPPRGGNSIHPGANTNGILVHYEGWIRYKKKCDQSKSHPHCLSTTSLSFPTYTSPSLLVTIYQYLLFGTLLPLPNNSVFCPLHS
jgi:hypothetical protein